MSNVINNIKHHMNVQTAGHIVMTAFALASLANIESFFAHLHPGLPLLSWGLGIALGTGLLVMAGLLSGMVWDWRDSRFQVVGGVAGALALISGGIQSGAYWPHIDYKIFALLIGMSLPIVGELGVALAVSAYTQAMRRQRMADAQSQLADGVRGHIGEAIAAIDKSKIEQQVNRAAALITKEIVDSTVEDMLLDLRNSRKSNVVVNSEVQPEVVVEKVTTTVTVTPIVDTETQTIEPQQSIFNDNDADFTDRMAAGKAAKQAQRQQELLNILLTNFNGQPSEVLNKSALAEQLNTTRQTIGKDIEALIDAKKLNINGHINVL